jgi:predicted secreted hydrolase
MSRHRRDAAAFIAAVLVLAVFLMQSPAPQSTPHFQPGNSINALLSAPAPAGFARAEQPRALEFPRDHASHASYRSEWWYFTGHLNTTDGHEFGFQLTLFRFEIDARQDTSNSHWRTPTVILGHFALSDLDSGQFHAYERLSRALPRIAGVSAQPMATWIDNWRIEYLADGHSPHWRLYAEQQGNALELQLANDGGVVAQGNAGLSRKSGAPGNASYYYSIPRLQAAGKLTIGAQKHAVTGTAWLDREWSTSALDQGQQGWDWFALQFEDRSSLMFYRLRRDDGSIDPHSAGSFVTSAGAVVSLDSRDVTITVDEHWTSPLSGSTYPHGWRLSVPRLNLSVNIQPQLADQEWRARFQYWEGAVEVNGTLGNAPVAGLGYVELTGY